MHLNARVMSVGSFRRVSELDRASTDFSETETPKSVIVGTDRSTLHKSVTDAGKNNTSFFSRGGCRR
jgi:hypothetical protein